MNNQMSPNHAQIQDKTLAIVVPCYNEEEMLPLTIDTLLTFINKLVTENICSNQSFIVFIDDGSRDNTWQLIEAAALNSSNRIHGIRLACNVGHQPALLAGLNYVTNKCSFAVSIDADLQDDINIIPQMIQKHVLGAEIVLGVRKKRVADTWFKRNSALIFYKILKKLGVKLIENHADFRLMSNCVLKNLSNFNEYNLFLRGLILFMHQKQDVVYYDRIERIAGNSKYTLVKMFSLAWNGITSFSIAPLRLISLVGVLIFIFSLIMIFYSLFSFFVNKTIPGWASVVIPLYFLGGIIILSIGIVGEYLAKIFLETKNRPRYLIDKVVGGV